MHGMLLTYLHLISELSVVEVVVEMVAKVKGKTRNLAEMLDILQR